MIRRNTLTAALAVSALSLTMATPAFAGKADDARKAIAAAQAKIETAHTMGSGRALPAESAQADESLKMAQADFKAGRKDEAIAEATHADALASTAIGRIQQGKDVAIQAARQERDDAAASAVSSQAQANDAQNQAADAQSQAAQANARADQAAQSAAEARSAAVAAAATPQPQVQTTVTTQQATTTPHRTTTTHKVVRRKTAPATSASAAKTTTTTTVTQSGT